MNKQEYIKLITKYRDMKDLNSQIKLFIKSEFWHLVSKRDLVSIKLLIAAAIESGVAHLFDRTIMFQQQELADALIRYEKFTLDLIDHLIAYNIKPVYILANENVTTHVHPTKDSSFDYFVNSYGLTYDSMFWILFSNNLFSRINQLSKIDIRSLNPISYAKLAKVTSRVGYDRVHALLTDYPSLKNTIDQEISHNDAIILINLANQNLGLMRYIVQGGLDLSLPTDRVLLYSFISGLFSHGTPIKSHVPRIINNIILDISVHYPRFVLQDYIDCEIDTLGYRGYIIDNVNDNTYHGIVGFKAIDPAILYSWSQNFDPKMKTFYRIMQLDSEEEKGASSRPVDIFTNVMLFRNLLQMGIEHFNISSRQELFRSIWDTGVLGKLSTLIRLGKRYGHNTTAPVKSKVDYYGEFFSDIIVWYKDIEMNIYETGQFRIMLANIQKNGIQLNQAASDYINLNSVNILTGDHNVDKKIVQGMIKTGSLEAFKNFIAITDYDFKGANALLIKTAATSDKLDFLKYLLVDLERTLLKSSKKHVIESAIRNANTEMLKFIMTFVDVEYDPVRVGSLRKIYESGRQEEVLDQMYRSKIQISTDYADIRTYINYISGNGRYELLPYLIRLGVDPILVFEKIEFNSTMFESILELLFITLEQSGSENLFKLVITDQMLKLYSKITQFKPLWIKQHEEEAGVLAGDTDGEDENESRCIESFEADGTTITEYPEGHQ